MSNTPTESEFDKAMHLIEHEWMLEGRSEEQIHGVRNFLSAKLPAIKQAVDKHVIGEDSQDNQVIVHYPGGVISHGGRVKEYGPSVSSGANIFSVTNNKLRAGQRKALYGGDKK